MGLDKNRRVKGSEAVIGYVEAEDAWTDEMEMAREQGMAVGKTVETNVFNPQTTIP